MITNPLNHYAYTDINEDGYFANLPLTSSIDIQYFTSEMPSGINDIGEKIKLYALENSLKIYSFHSPHFLEIEENKLNQELTLVSIPSIFFGSSIKKGTTELKINYSGTLVAKLQDVKENGELLQTYPIDNENYNKCAGVVMYNHGFIILTGSWSIKDDLKWCTFATSSNEQTYYSSSFDVDFKGINHIQTLTMMAHAPKLQFNFSNNPTYIKYEDRNKLPSTVGGYYEIESREIKNITNYPYENFTGSLDKQTYISKIGIFDENKNLIAIAKLSKPVKKTEGRDFTFKLKLDF